MKIRKGKTVNIAEFIDINEHIEPVFNRRIFECSSYAEVSQS
jgi:hypothetical protein